MEKLILIDGNSLINRAFYATPLMSNSKGVPTNAILGFVNMLLKLISTEKPKYLLVAFDRREPTFRHLMYTEYKGTRKPMPEELRPQIPLLKEVLDAMGIKHFDKAGAEADDIIGTLSKSEGVESIVVTGDKDSFQLVRQGVKVFFTRRGITDIDVLDHLNFKEKIGVDPLQIIDLKALMGDKSDNIPGIPGVGEKIATDLILKYGSVENLLEHTGELKGKLKEKVEAGRASCLLSYKLATIDTKVEIGLSLNDLTFSVPFPNGLKRLFAELEFRSLTKKSDLFLEEELLAPNANEEKNAGEELATQIIKINDLSEIKGLCKDKIAVVVGDNISLSNGKDEFVLPIKQSFFDEGFMLDQAINAVGKLMEDKKGKTIVFSSKKIRHTFRDLGYEINGEIEDVSLLKYIVDFTGKEESLVDAILFYGLAEKTPAHSLYKMYDILMQRIVENDQLSLYKDIELPLSKVLYDMELCGFKVDEKIIDELNKKYKAIIADLVNQIHELAGEEFNVNSPKQLGHILFEKLGLNTGKKKKAGQSTNAEVLEELASTHPIVPLVLSYRRVSKLNSTYIEGFKPLIDKKTGLIHTVFNQTLTSTGRLSSREPNLQNLPIRDEEGKEIRRFFIPSKQDRILVGADYSQIELRLLAHFSESQKLIDAYNKGEDIHSHTAAEVFGVELSEVTKEQRRNAKAVNFGIIYGISEYGLAKNIKISAYEARNYIDRYFKSYPSVKEYMEKNVEFARENGYISTLCGRKRYIRDINSSNYNLRSFSERAAMNMPLQGSSADIIKIAMINVYNRLEREGLKSKLILQVHDELVVDTLIDEKDKVERILKEEMEGAVKLRVPLVADVYSGKNLSEAK